MWLSSGFIFVYSIGTLVGAFAGSTLIEIDAATKAVDMPLRLDNANALPTYPQQKQKKKEAA